jgi:hypothetical protein
MSMKRRVTVDVSRSNSAERSVPGNEEMGKTTPTTTTTTMTTTTTRGKQNDDDDNTTTKLIFTYQP